MPFAGRPFEGLVGESDWVAIREILPAATARLTLRPESLPEGAVTEVTVATVLPLAWPALHRADGTVFVATQTSGSSGDASRDLAAALLAALSAPAGSPVTQLPAVTGDTPRLQDLIVPEAAFEVEVHEGFDFWVAQEDLDAESSASLERANATVTRWVARPGCSVPSGPAACWFRSGISIPPWRPLTMRTSWRTLASGMPLRWPAIGR